MSAHRDIPDEVVQRARDYDRVHWREDRSGERGGSWGSVPPDQVRRLLFGAYGASELTAARDEFLAASVAVWREIDRLDAAPEGYHPVRMSVELRKTERAAWEKYRDLLDSRPATMLQPVTFGADGDDEARRVPMHPVSEDEDVW